MYSRSRSLRVAALTRPIASRAQFLFACTILAVFAAASLQALQPSVAHAATTYTFTAQPTSDNSGTVVAWGTNGDGQTDVPSGLSGVTAIAAGDSHSLALKSDGTVVAWGLGRMCPAA